MRLAVYTDYEYCSDGKRLYGQRAFVVFMEALGAHVDRLVLVGRMDRRRGTSHYPLAEDTELLALPHYESLARPWSVARSLLASVARFWRLLADVDAVWVLGPYPHSVALALITLARRRTLVLGVRQDMPLYVRSRRPDKRWMHFGADVLEAIWKLLARRHGVVVVGPELARKYERSAAVLDVTVSLIHEGDLREADPGRDYGHALSLLTVGRLDAEKNPLLLADVLAGLRATGRDWSLTICGDGPMREPLQERLQELGLAGHAKIAGYVPIDGGLLDLYRESHAFLHVSWTEGFPQVLAEAFASGLPVVATAVGGVAAGVGDAALLIPPGDAGAAVAALGRVAEEPQLRAELTARGSELARHGTLEASSQRVCDFIAEAHQRAARTRRNRW